MPDFSDVQDLQKRQTAARQPTPEEWTRHQAMQETIVLRMETLLDLDEWQTYIAHVEKFRERDAAQLEALRDRLESGQLVGEELARVSQTAFGLRSRLEVYRDVLAIPAAVLRQAGRAVPPAKPAATKRRAKKRRRR